MTKIREPLSIEQVLSNVIKKLDENNIKNITNKSASHFRKCSDPDLEQQLDHRDAVKIDKACIQKGLAPYLLNSHNYIILKELEKARIRS